MIISIPIAYCVSMLVFLQSLPLVIIKNLIKKIILPPFQATYIWTLLNHNPIIAELKTAQPKLVVTFYDVLSHFRVFHFLKIKSNINGYEICLSVGIMHPTDKLTDRPTNKSRYRCTKTQKPYCWIISTCYYLVVSHMADFAFYEKKNLVLEECSVCLLVLSNTNMNIISNICLS